MSNISYVKTYSEPEFNIKEILRYSGCKESDENIDLLVQECIEECRTKLIYKVCFEKFDTEITNSIIDFGFIRIKSAGLAKNLDGCKKSIIFAATAGIEIDRLIARYGRISPSKSLIFQAIGAERIESLCDTFCDNMADEYNKKGLYLRPRFSPGYGDLPLSIQEDIFRTLDCSKKIGISLNKSLLMSPSKSVTAIIGISDKCVNKQKNLCKSCKNADCTYRRTK